MYIRKIPSTVAGKPDRWKVEIDRVIVSGTTKVLKVLTKTFGTKAEAEAWGTLHEGKILNGGVEPEKFRKAHTVREAIQQYRSTLPKKASNHGTYRRWLGETKAAQANPAFKSELHFIDQTVASIVPHDIMVWANARGGAMTDDDTIPGQLKQVETSTVRREWNALLPVFNYAVFMLKWIDVSPMPRKMRGQKDPRPQDNEPRREFIPGDDEIGACYRAAKLLPDSPIKFHIQRAALAFELATETTMRTGEMATLVRGRINFDTMVAVIPKRFSKTGEKVGKGRDVSLTERACEILKRLLAASKDDRPFPMSAHELTRQGTALRRKAGIAEFRGHDARRTACTWMADVMPLQALMDQTGHTNPKTLMVYYNKSAESRAQMMRNRVRVERPHLTLVHSQPAPVEA